MIRIVAHKTDDEFVKIDHSSASKSFQTRSHTYQRKKKILYMSIEKR